LNRSVSRHSWAPLKSETDPDKKEFIESMGCRPDEETDVSDDERDNEL